MNKKILSLSRIHQGAGVVFMLGGWGLVAAQASASVSEEDFLTEMPIVLSVSRLSQRLDETPGAVTLIDRDWIRLSGARDVADLLRLVPGFQSSSSFEAAAPQASYHGAFGGYSSRIQVLIDGRSVYSPYVLGSVAPGLQQVALSDIERIEVLRGSNSATYGARAMLGVINIVTRHTVDTLGAQAALGVGENQVRDAQARLGWGTDDASFRLTLDRRADGGLAGANGHNEIDRVNFRADVRGPSGDEIQVRAGALNIDSGKGFAGNIGDPVRDGFYGANHAQLDWRRSLGADEDLALTLTHTSETYRDTFPYSLRPLKIDGSIDIDFSGRASNSTVLLQHTFRRGPTLRMVWGGELRREDITSRPLYNTGSTFVTEFARMFANAEWRMAQSLLLNAGALVERSSMSGSSLAPRVMLNWQVADGHTLRAGISKAYRPPTTYEKYGDVRYYWQGRVLQRTLQTTGTVEPESVLAREIGYLWDWPRQGLQLDVRGFNERIEGLIKRRAIAGSPGWLDYVNSQAVSVQGLEYQFTWRPWRDTRLVFSQASLDVADNVLSSGERVVSTPPPLATALMVAHRFSSGMDLSLSHQDNKPMTLQGSSAVRAIRRTDLRLGMPLQWGRKRGEVALVVQNLGSSSPDYRPDFAFQRRAFLTLRIEN
jgi:iron complex outermembrane receptor protein